VDSTNIEAMGMRKWPRIFANVRDKSVVGFRQGETDRDFYLASGRTQRNTPLIYDEANHRIFVAGASRQVSKSWIRTPAKSFATLPIAEMVDDMAFDVASKRIYIPCNEFTVVFQQKDADHSKS